MYVYLNPALSAPASPATAWEPLPPASEARRHPFEAVQFVRQAALLAQSDPALAERGHANATGLCRVVLELAVDQFGAEGKDVLLDWNIARSEDVGLIVARLIAAGAAQPAESDRLADFDRLFDLNEPPTAWQLQWE